MIAETNELTSETSEPAVSGGPLGALGINVLSFTAQLLNFAIVVLVLWRWVFTPLVKAMEKRREEIQSGLEKSLQADKKLEEASAEKEKALKSARAETLTMIEEAEKTAAGIRQDKMNETKREIEKVADEARAKLMQEKENTFQALQRDVAEMVSMAVTKVAAGLDEKTQRSLIDKAIKDLEKA